MIKLDWQEDAFGWIATLPTWTQLPYPPLDNVLIWLQRRPHYCDRGRWRAACNAPLDSAEGWPRYYFDLETAKREIEAWVNGRKELNPSAPAP